MDCRVCVIAMLADLFYEKVLADNPNYRPTSDHDWMRYLNLLGFQVDQVDENTPPSGRRLFCGIIGKVMCVLGATPTPECAGAYRPQELEVLRPSPACCKHILS